MKTQRIITLRLPELCSYPQELMFPRYLFISLLLHHNHSSVAISLPFFHSFPSFHPYNPPQSPSTSKLSGCCLLWSEAEWGDLAPFPSPRSLHQVFKSIHVYAPNLCTLYFSTSRHEFNPGLMRTGSPLCTCSEGEGGRQREQKKREGGRASKRKSRVKRK